MSIYSIIQADAARLSIAELRYLHIQLTEALSACPHGSAEAVRIAGALRIVMNELNRRNRMCRIP